MANGFHPEATTSPTRQKLERDHPARLIRWRNLMVPTWGYPHSASSVAVAACEGGILILIHHVGSGQTSAGTTLSVNEAQMLLRAAKHGCAAAVKNVLWDQREGGVVVLTRNHIVERDSGAVIWPGEDLPHSRGAKGGAGVVRGAEEGDEEALADAYDDAEAGVVLVAGDQHWFRYAVETAIAEAARHGTDRVRSVA